MRKLQKSLRQLMKHTNRHQSSSIVIILTTTRTVLDLGCGTGMLSVFALRHGAEHITALDLNSNMVTLAKR